MTRPEEEEFILLKRKVEELIGSYGEVNRELEKSKDENRDLGLKLQSAEGELSNLRKEVEKVKLSGAILGDRDESHVAKKRINELVREIDNCIALLNNI